MALALPNEIKEQARSLYVSGRPVSEICKRLQLKDTTIRQWIIRLKWHKVKQIASQTITDALCGHDSQTTEQLSQKVRSRFATVVARQLNALEEANLESIDQLRNTPDRQGLAAVTKAVYDTAAGIFGWGDEKASGVIVIADVRSFDTKPAEPVTDVQAIVTTTGSVSQSDAISAVQPETPQPVETP